MGLHIDTCDTTFTAETRAMLNGLDDTALVSLGVLFGVELCVLGGTEHPACWEALGRAWRQLSPEEQGQLTEACTQSMLCRGLITRQEPGRGVKALVIQACYKLSPQLRLLLNARKSPAFMIATRHESRSPAIAYFRLQGTSAIVQEIPERMDGTCPGQPESPLDVMFSYRLSTPALAAAELARWALKPVPDQPQPPCVISFFGRDEGGCSQLTVHRNGEHSEKAHLTAPDLSADLSQEQLASFLANAIATWPDDRAAR